MRDKCLVDPVNNVNSNRKSSLVRYTDDESDGDGNKEREVSSEVPRPEKPDHRQNQKTSRNASNTRYYNYSNYF